MASPAILKIDILADARKANKAFDQVGTSARSAGSKIGGFAKSAALGFAGVAVGAALVGKSLIDAAIESEKVTKQTNAVIKSMGGVSKVTAKQVEQLSRRLSEMSGVDDELIQAGQNILLTFGKVRNEVGKGNNIFDRATESALNMSVALGTDLKAANIQLGKALNDPVKGITALSRAGVSFTAQQKEQIKTLVKSGDTLAAQKIILAELEKQFAGSAAAQATAGAKLSVVWGNLQEDLGKRLLPLFETVASWLSKALPDALDFLSGALGPVIDGLSDLVSEGFEKIRGWWDANSATLEGYWTSFAGVATDVLGDLVALIQRTVLPWLKKFADWFINNKTAVIAALAGIAAAFAAWAAAATWAAVASLAAAWPLLAVAAAAGVVAAIMYTVADRGNGAADTLIRLGLGAYATGRMFWQAFVGIVGLMETIGRAIWRIIEAVKQLIGWLGKIKVPDISIPGSGGGWLPWRPVSFDNGGVMPGPRGIHQLAMVAGGETILPTHRGGTFGQTVINVNVTAAGLGADSPEIQRAVVKALRGYVGRNGPLPIPVRTVA